MGAPTVDHEAPPDDWMSWVVVERVIAGNRPGPPITEAERREVARRMLARGNTTNEIAHALRPRFKRARALVAQVERGRN